MWSIIGQFTFIAIFIIASNCIHVINFDKVTRLIGVSSKCKYVKQKIMSKQIENDISDLYYGPTNPTTMSLGLCKSRICPHKHWSRSRVIQYLASSMFISFKTLILIWYAQHTWPIVHPILKEKNRVDIERSLIWSVNSTARGVICPIWIVVKMLQKWSKDGNRWGWLPPTIRQWSYVLSTSDGNWSSWVFNIW